MSPAPKRERVARGVRAAITRGELADGTALSPGKLAAEHGVHRQVAWQALADLQGEGYVSADERHRFRVNATHASRQQQLTRNRIERVERYLRQVLVILGDDPCRYS